MKWIVHNPARETLLRPRSELALDTLCKTETNTHQQESSATIDVALTCFNYLP